MHQYRVVHEVLKSIEINFFISFTCFQILGQKSLWFKLLFYFYNVIFTLYSFEIFCIFFFLM